MQIKSRLCIYLSMLTWYILPRLNRNDQRNAAVIILRYTLLPHYGLWEVIWALYTYLLLTQWEEIRTFKVQNYVYYMEISRLRCDVDLVHEYFVLACKNHFKDKRCWSKLSSFCENISLIRKGNQRYYLLINTLD